MFFIPKVIPRPAKQAAVIVGFLLALFSLPVDFGYGLMYLARIMSNHPQAITIGVTSLIVTALTLGTGGTLFWQALASLQNKPSEKFTLPSAKKLAGVFGLYLLMGAIIFNSQVLANLAFPATVAVVAALPPLIAVSWFMNQEAGNLTWRQSSVVFMGSAMIGLVIGGSLQWLLLMGGVILMPRSGELNLALLFQIVEGEYYHIWQDRESSIYFFIQIAVLYPLVTEFVKPLIVLPFSGYLARREIFLLGAIAGAGFAALENLILAGAGFQGWVWLLILQFLGGAIHPLSSGLVALGWQDVLRGKIQGGSGWLAHFGMAVAFRSLWNTGFLASLVLVISNPTSVQLTITNFLLGLIGAGFLTGLGAVALWLGYLVAQGGTAELLRFHSYPSNHRAVAIWAIASLIVALPAGLLTSYLLFS